MAAPPGGDDRRAIDRVMVAKPANRRRTPLVDDENRAGAEIYIARIRAAMAAYCLVLTGLSGPDFRPYPDRPGPSPSSSPPTPGPRWPS